MSDSDIIVKIKLVNGSNSYTTATVPWDVFNDNDPMALTQAIESVCTGRSAHRQKIKDNARFLARSIRQLNMQPGSVKIITDFKVHILGVSRKPIKETSVENSPKQYALAGTFTLKVTDLDSDASLSQDIEVGFNCTQGQLIWNVIDRAGMLLRECASAHYGNCVDFDKIQLVSEPILANWVGRQCQLDGGRVKEFSANTKLFECVKVNDKPMTHSYLINLTVSTVGR